MRRLASLLLSLLTVLPTVADAKVLLVYHDARNNADCTAIDCKGAGVIRQQVQAIFERFGVDYKAVGRGQTRTEWVRTGNQVWRTGAGASVEHFDVVVHVGNLKQAHGVGTTDRVDSIGLAGPGGGLEIGGVKYPTVPQVFFELANNFITASGRCSSGTNSGTDGTPASPINYWHVTKYPTTDPTIRWRSGFLHAALLAYTPPGGVRVLLAQNMGGAAQYEREEGIPALDADSIVASNDSVLVWARLNTNVSGAAQMIYAITNHVPADQMDPMIPLMALAYADSLTGGLVFENEEKLPLDWGIHVRGGWRRSERHIMGGISPNDSTQLKASVDSLLALGVPFTVGVNVDSLAAYSSDRYWWLRAAPKVHFTPENHGGLDSGAAGNGNASWQQPRDMFGRYRNRKLTVDSDTGLARLVRANFWKCDSAFGSARVDHVLIPPDDDWWPYNWRRNNPDANQDSLFYVLADSAGVRGIVINPLADGDGWIPFATNAKSPIRQQGAYRLTMGRNAGSRFNLLATHPPADSGSARWNRATMTDAYEPGSPIKGLQNFFHSAFGAGRMAALGTLDAPLVAGDSLNTPMSIYTIHASDLGTGAHASGRPTMPGWWQIKYLVNSAKVVNKLAGRTIIDFKYPQDIKIP